MKESDALQEQIDQYCREAGESLSAGFFLAKPQFRTFAIQQQKSKRIINLKKYKDSRFVLSPYYKSISRILPNDPTRIS